MDTQNSYLKVVRGATCLSSWFADVFLDDADSSAETPPPRLKAKGTKLQYENGYPKIPDPDKMKHKEMADALRDFMTHHYREVYTSTVFSKAH